MGFNKPYNWRKYPLNLQNSYGKNARKFIIEAIIEIIETLYTSSNSWWTIEVKPKQFLVSNIRINHHEN